MFEFVMLLGLLMAGLSQLLPDGEEEEPRPGKEERSRTFRADRGGAYGWPETHCRPESRPMKVATLTARPKRNPCI